MNNLTPYHETNIQRLEALVNQRATENPQSTERAEAKGLLEAIANANTGELIFANAELKGRIRHIATQAAGKSITGEDVISRIKSAVATELDVSILSPEDREDLAKAIIEGTFSWEIIAGRLNIVNGEIPRSDSPLADALKMLNYISEKKFPINQLINVLKQSYLVGVANKLNKKITSNFAEKLYPPPKQRSFVDANMVRLSDSDVDEFALKILSKVETIAGFLDIPNYIVKDFNGYQPDLFNLSKKLVQYMQAEHIPVADVINVLKNPSIGLNTCANWLQGKITTT